MRRTKLTLASLLIAAVFLGTAVSSLAAPKHKDAHLFSDADQAAWALPDIAKMKAVRVIKGYEDGTFRPNASISRQDAVLMAVRLVGLEEEAEEATGIELPFEDANKIADYAKGGVALAYREGWFGPLFAGHKDYGFQPNKPASRLWVTVILVNALTDNSPEETPEHEPLDFVDSDEIEESLAWYIAKAVELGLIKGFDDGTLQPNKPVTRAQMAALLSRTDSNESFFEFKYRNRNRHKGYDAIEGTVVSTVYDRITVKTDELETVTVEFAADVCIIIDQTLSTWEDIEPGDEVEIKVDGNGLAVFIKVEGDDDDDDQEEIEYEGIVTAIVLPSKEARGSIEIETEAGVRKFVLVPGAYKKDDLELADIKTGMMVEVEVVDDVVVKIKIEELDDHDNEDKQDKPEKTKGKEGKGEKQRGKIASITLPTEEAEGSITICLGNSANTRTFKLAPEVEVDGAGSLEEIPEGIRVELKLSGGYVTEIEVDD